MKLVSISLVSWLAGLSLIMANFTDFASTTAITLIITALLFSLAYAPALFWLRQ